MILETRSNMLVAPHYTAIGAPSTSGIDHICDTNMTEATGVSAESFLHCKGNSVQSSVNRNHNETMMKSKSIHEYLLSKTP